MADFWLEPPKFEDDIDVAGEYILRPMGFGVVGRWKISLVSLSFVGSVTIKKRQAGTSDAFAAVPYIPWHLNGSASDGVMVGTAITGTSHIEVPAENEDIDIDCTA